MTAAAAQYDKEFMDYQSRSSAYSARAITRLLSGTLKPTSVLDVGCATGTWLRAWSEAGVSDVNGVDGDYVDRAQLVVPSSHFQAADLSRPITLNRRFELVQSLEVGEHIAACDTAQFVENITSHAQKFILFSAAPPGQGGEHHINEQSYDFWRSQFAKAGYDAYDYVRPLIAHDRDISYWYRYNILLYVNRNERAGLSPDVVSTAIPEGATVTDVSPLGFKLRKSIVRRLPYSARDSLARMKARFAPTGRF